MEILIFKFLQNMVFLAFWSYFSSKILSFPVLNLIFLQKYGLYSISVKNPLIDKKIEPKLWLDLSNGFAICETARSVPVSGKGCQLAFSDAQFNLSFWHRVSDVAFEKKNGVTSREI